MLKEAIEDDGGAIWKVWEERLIMILLVTIMIDTLDIYLGFG